MSNKTFKCPKCQHPNYSDDAPYELDGKPLRYCNGSTCTFAWSHLNDHLYLKDSEEIVKCAIHPSILPQGDRVRFLMDHATHPIESATSLPGFSGFEFGDGSVSLDSPWAWKNEYGLLMQGLMTGDNKLTPVLAKFVRVKGAA